MLSILFWVFVGAMLGWFVVPQPQWAKKLYETIRSIVNTLISKIKQ